MGIYRNDYIIFLYQKKYTAIQIRTRLFPECVYNATIPIKVVNTEATAIMTGDIIMTKQVIKKTAWKRFKTEYLKFCALQAKALFYL